MEQTEQMFLLDANPALAEAIQILEEMKREEGILSQTLLH